MRRFLAAAAIGATAALAFAGPALADNPTVYTVHIKSTPDDGNPPWARDTLDRKTTISPGETEGTWTVTIDDDGTFSTAGATKTAEGQTPVGEVTGTMTGHAEWSVTGTLLTNPSTAEIDRSTEATKGDFTSKWPARFFAEGATVGAIRDWTWTYSTGCETRTESEDDGANGDITGKKCPSPTPSATPSASASKSPAGAAPATTAPTTKAPTLPVTGSAFPMVTAVGFAGGGVLVGAGLWLFFRRRRVRFTA